MSPQKVGSFAEKIVKKNLWQWNYRVKDVSRIARMECDLLVDDTFRVELKSMRGENTTVQVNPDSFDVLCVVLLIPQGSQIFYLRDKENLKNLRKTNNIYHINTVALETFFTKKPKEVFA